MASVLRLSKKDEVKLGQGQRQGRTACQCQFVYSPLATEYRLSMIPALLVALRPRQWVKNLLVFGAPLFAFVTDPDELLKVVGAFVSFCAVSSAVYLLNDCFDLKQDRLHPVKKRRPLA